MAEAGLGSTIVTGWSQSGVIRVGERRNGISCQANFKIRGSYSIQFSLQGSPALGIFSGVACSRPAAIALIRWSVGGNTVTRRVSVTDGTCVTGVGEAVQVQLIDATPLGSGTYVATIQISLGTRGSTKQPAFLTLPSLIVSPAAVPGTGTDITIPDDIGSVSLMILAGNANGPGLGIAPRDTIQVRLMGAYTDIVVYDPRDYDWVPLPPGVQIVRCAVDVGLPFAVSFLPFVGIEG